MADHRDDRDREPAADRAKKVAPKRVATGATCAPASQLAGQRLSLADPCTRCPELRLSSREAGKPAARRATAGQMDKRSNGRTRRWPARSERPTGQRAAARQADRQVATCRLVWRLTRAGRRRFYDRFARPIQLEAINNLVYRT